MPAPPSSVRSNSEREAEPCESHPDGKQDASSDEDVKPSATTPASTDVAKEPSKEAEKHTTLLQALADKGNRDVAMLFAAFSAILALVPPAGLLATERILRSFVTDANTRWMYSGGVAVLLVNAVLAAYVLWCFAEGFPSSEAETAHPGGAKKED
eukprot:TRINITY_DN107456_c0_g1_i1.p1 TRINITY_DN107456_c0_g1~~TRINITY_DN107456_c0_g1_i1.p1  ORF type:complete len:155 (-),score=36.46 TRINITY_DN107456_c0_g1_i1:426-890(-)